MKQLYFLLDLLLGLCWRLAKSKNADFFLILGGSRWWLVGSVHATFSRHFEKAYTKYCLLSSPKRSECSHVCFHCLSGIVIVTLNRSYRIHTGCGRSWQTFLEQFWLRWFSLLHTYWGQVYWYNASLVRCTVHKPHSLKPAEVSSQFTGGWGSYWIVWCVRNTPVEFMDHRLVTVSTHHHLLFLQLFGNLQNRVEPQCQ